MKKNYLSPEMELLEFVSRTNLMNGFSFLDAIFGNSSDNVSGEEDGVNKPSGIL